MNSEKLLITTHFAWKIETFIFIEVWVGYAYCLFIIAEQ